MRRRKSKKQKKSKNRFFEAKKPQALLWQKPPSAFLCHRSEGNIWTRKKQKIEKTKLQNSFLSLFRHCSIIIIFFYRMTSRQERRREKIRISFREEAGWVRVEEVAWASHAKYSITHTYSTTTCERNTYRRTKRKRRKKF